MRAYERLLKYVVVRTPSDHTSTTVPTTSCQFDLAHLLVTELKELGLTDASVDEKCFVYASLPATKGYEEKTKLGFVAHMDTVSDFCDHDITPIVTENYDGEDLVLGTSGRTLSVKNFPHLPSLKGRTLITTDGTTVLGADDKAGIAEIMTMLERIQKEEIPHGKISVAFTPDEEAGSGVNHFNVKDFDAEFAYTMDGGPEGEIQYENFNACEAIVEIKGFNVHPGSSKDTMINAALVAMEFNAMLPSCETPRGTEGYEGFYHLCEMSGDVANAKLEYIIRDHDPHFFEARKNTMHLIAKQLNAKWGEGTVTLTIHDQYRNMSEVIQGCMHLIDNAVEAARLADIVPDVAPIRGGTDGCRLSYMGPSVAAPGAATAPRKTSTGATSSTSRGSTSP